MADEIDLANDLIDRDVALALSKMRQQTPKTLAGSKFCVKCDDDIPPQRQQLGFNTCVPCASQAERSKSLYT